MNFSTPIHPYAVTVQAGPEDILEAQSPNALNLKDLSEWPSVSQIVVAMPALDGADAAAEKLKTWGFNSYIGDTYNVCERILGLHKDLSFQDYSVRVLSVWKHVDLRFVDAMVSTMQHHAHDLVIAPKNYDITMAADVASHRALRRVSDLAGDDAEGQRARFNPWGYMESHAADFDVHHCEPAPTYPDSQVEQILESSRAHAENEFFGRDYAGSRYHFLAPKLDAGMKILDIACGAGFGSDLLAEKASMVVGVDYLSEYVERAQLRYGARENLTFMQGDAQTFVYQDGAFFDAVLSFHTLEHVPDDEAMMQNLRSNTRMGGLLVLEVPLLAQRPLGQPINPFHFREYTRERVLELVENAGFEVQEQIGICRGFRVPALMARDAFQVWARRIS